MNDGTTFGRYVTILMAALLSVFGLIWAFTATERMSFLPPEAAPWQAHVNMIRHCDVGDVAILGSSRASAAFLPKLLNENATNLAMTGSTPIEAYYEVNDSLKCPHPPQVFILSFAGYDLEHTSWFWTRSARFGLLDFSDLQDIAHHAYSRDDTGLYQASFGSEPPPTIKNWLYAWHFPPFDFGSLLTAVRKGARVKSENTKLEAETIALKGQHLLGAIPEDRCAQDTTWEAGQASFKASSLLSFYFERLITLAAARGSKVLFISPPLNVRSFSALQLGFKRDYIAFLQKMQRAHPAFRVVGPVFSSLDMCSFGDSEHVNQKGAEAFSRDIAPLVEKALTN